MAVFVNILGVTTRIYGKETTKTLLKTLCTTSTILVRSYYLKRCGFARVSSSLHVLSLILNVAKDR